MTTDATPVSLATFRAEKTSAAFVPPLREISAAS